MVTEQEMDDLDLAAWPWSYMICIQCTKPPEVVTRTAKLLAKMRYYEEEQLLEGQ